MAGDSVIGALRVVLGADTADLDRGLKSSQDKLAVFADVAKASFALAGAAVVAAATAIGTGIKSAIDNADKVNKLSQSTGTTTEEFTKLRYAAELADISQESLGKSLGKLSRAMVEVAGGGTGPAAQAFTALGISVKNTDGTLKSSSEVLSEVAGKFEGYKDGAGKTALAIALFGKAGAEMIPLLNSGKQGLADAADEAERYGLVLDKKTTAAAEAFNDNLKRMEKINEGVIIQVTARMLPAFEQLSEAMLKAKESGTVVNLAADAITGTLKFLASAVVITADIFKGFATDVVAAFNVIKLGIQWKFGEAGEIIEKWKVDTTKQIGDTKAIMSTLWDDVPTFSWDTQLVGIRSMNKEVQAIAGEWGKVAAPIIAADTATKNALQSFLDGQAKRTAGQVAEAATIGKSVGEQAKLRLEYEARAIALAKNIPLDAAALLQIQQSGDAAALAAMKVAGANATIQAMSPAQLFAANMTSLQQLYDAGVISLETFGARQQQIAEQAGATWQQASASIAGSFATIAGAFGKESSAMAKAAKVFGIIQGTISMFTGAAKALELPFPANIAAVAAVLAKGASLVASIKGQNVPTGMMTGGSMMVRGGGGPDSVPVNMMLSPGEQVDVWRPDQGGGADPRGGASSGGSKTVVLQGFAWGRDQMTQMFEFLNEGMRDGHKLDLKFA